MKDLLKNLFDLHQFAGELNTNVTTQTGTGQDLSAEMKVYYDKELIRLAGPELVHDQFAQLKNIPKNSGKTIEFRKYDSFGKALTPLVEGVTPDGRKMNVTTIMATVQQYGDYVTISDVLDLTAIDNNLLEAQELLADQAGRTLDTITREVMVGGTNVLYVDGKLSRATLGATNKLKVADIKNGVRILKNANAKKINGAFWAIIHPDVEYDITNDPDWINASQYAGSTQIFEGEIGKIHGVRFIETTEAKVFESAGAAGETVYATMLLANNFYGTTKVEGGGLQFIVKQKGSAGTGDPLDQRATAGWKAIKTAVRLVEQYGLRIESCSSFNAAAV
ncbi:N4-gp56 family major capsid protein [Clostridiales Family XIII bacterium PM5-7]